MTDAWGGHRAAAFVAIEAVGQLQEALSLAADAADRAIGAIQEAVGQTHVESALNAQAFIAEINDRVQECYGISQGAQSELERYASGF
jgi:hypothetical protein